MDNLYLCYFFATFVKVSKSVTGRKLQHIRGELFGVIGAEAFGKILIMNREINAENQQIAKQTPSFTPNNVKLGVFVLFKK